ncbi:protease [Lithospermum erythrorhizon]|uniref:Protease n=1 Tax=Lithospermum erythrorhizon TaxID=34254 RepID=A0AAV3NQ55_LITER
MEDQKSDHNSGIFLDWDTLLGTSDTEEEAAPPQIMVVKNPTKRKLQKMGTEDNIQEEEELTEELFQEYSDNKLMEAIERQKGTSAFSSKLHDGGEKLRRRLMLMETELERRRHLKDNAKWENQRKPHDLNCSGSRDGNQKETPCHVKKVSKFAASFHKKMENPTDKVFRNELSMLNRCGDQKSISSGNHLSARRHKGSLSSRQTQFVSPGNLSLHGDKCILPKGVQNGRLSMISSPSSSRDRPTTKCSDKRSSSQAHASNDCEKRNRTFVLVDLDEPEVAEMVPEVDQLDECMKDTTVYYPSRDDAESVEICYADFDCLGPESYLTSTIINFYIRYLQQCRSSLSKLEDNYHFFNTYFYEKLKETWQQKNDNKSSFSKIRRWWKGVKLFEKSYIFLPIHDQSHWSLIIICIPDKNEGMGPIILHLDSLGIHHSNLIFHNIRRLLIGEWSYMVKEDPYPCLPFLRSIQESFQEKKIEVPQQSNEYDCGVFVLFFIERFIERAPKRMKEEDLSMFGRQWFKPAEASRLRVTIRKLLKDEFKKAKEHNCLLKS